MTVKLLLLKSGEDIISDVKEMLIGDEDSPKVVGYFLHKPCVVKMTPPTNIPEKFEENMDPSQASFQVTLFPWMPLSKDNTIPVSTDWVVTMVTPSDKLNKMYVEEVINYKKDEQNSSINEQPNSNKSD